MDIQAIGAQAPLIEVRKAAPSAATEEVSAAQAQPKDPIYDEYVPEDGTARQPIGLYEVVPDEDGRPAIRFDDPDRAERTTTNTDRVDRELERLRKKGEELQRQIQSAADPRQVRQLQERIRQVEHELSQKDNDAYRRRHAVIS